MNQLQWLLWKTYKLQIRSIIGLVIEIVIPAFLVIVIVPFRSIVRSTRYPNITQYEPFILSKPNFSPLVQLAYQPNASLLNNIMKNVEKELNLTVVGMFF